MFLDLLFFIFFFFGGGGYFLVQNRGKPEKTSIFLSNPKPQTPNPKP